MKVDTVVTLANGKNYLLLLESDIQDEDYFLSVLLDENNEPTDEYIVLKEINKNGKTYVKKETKLIILKQLLDNYRMQYQDEFSE